MFHNTKFYVVTLIVYEMHEMKFIYPNANVMGFHFLKTVSSRWNYHLSFFINSDMS
jgi:hypothetical protein